MGLGVKWSGLVVDGDQIGDRWWRPDQPVWWSAWWSTAYDQLSRFELNLYSSMHGWQSERWVLGVFGSVMREGLAEIFKCVMSVRSGLVVDDS